MVTLAAATSPGTTQTLTWPWLVGVIAVTTIAVVVVVIARSARQRAKARASDEDTRWVANSSRMAELPELKVAVRRYRIWQWLSVACLAACLFAASVIAARPVTVEVKQSTMGTRDIVLCLDISGSMLEYDRQVVRVFSTLLEEFQGERIALSIFNETSRTVFPLTNDYEMVAEQLELAYDALDPAVLTFASNAIIDRYLDYVTGTLLTGTQSSLIGDGLANCTLLFDDSGSQERSRSIILATDNDLQGEPVYTLSQALDLTRERDIEVSGLYGKSNWVFDPSVERDFQQSIVEAGGHYYRVDDPSAVDEIVERVQAQQAVDLEAAPEVTRTENVGGWIVFALIAAAGAIAVGWRLRE